MALSFANAGNVLEEARANAMPTAQSRETASSRLQSRLAGQQQGQQRQINDQFAGRGRSTSGAAGLAQSQSQAASRGAFATGLADINADHEKRRQEGAGLLSTIGANIGNLANQQQGLGIQQQIADTGQFSADTQRTQVGNEFAVGNERNRISALQQIADEMLGQGKLDLDTLLGKGKLDLEESALEETRQNNISQGNINALNSFGQFGNLFAGPEGSKPPEHDQRFNDQMSALLSSLFGGISNRNSGQGGL
jgi:hypothetical protein